MAVEQPPIQSGEGDVYDAANVLDAGAAPGRQVAGRQSAAGACLPSGLGRQRPHFLPGMKEQRQQ